MHTLTALAAQTAPRAASLDEEARQAWQQEKQAKKASADAASAPAAAGNAGSLPKPKRAVVWKSPGNAATSAATTPAQSVGAAGPSLDLAAMQSALQRSVQSSVRESLQASLHAELAEVKRALRAAEEHASIDRKRADARHSTLMSSVEANAKTAKQTTEKAEADAASSQAQAQAQAQQAAKAAAERADAATAEARAAVAARFEAEAATREREREVERLKAEHSSALQRSEEASAARLAQELQRAATALAEVQAQGVQQLDAAADEARGRERTALTREKVVLEILTRELATTERQAVAARAEGEAAAEARLQPELRKSNEVANDYSREMEALEAATSDLAAAKAVREGPLVVPSVPPPPLPRPPVGELCCHASRACRPVARTGGPSRTRGSRRGARCEP